MSNVFKPSNSKYYYSRFHVDGKEYKQSTRTTNKNNALKIAQQRYQDALLEFNNIGKNTITLQSALEGYASTKPEDRNLQASFKFFLKWLPDNNIFNLDDNLQNFTTSTFELVVKTRRKQSLKDNSIKAAIGFLSRMIQWAKRNGYIVSDFVTPAIKTKKGRERYLSLDEEIKLLAELDPNRIHPADTDHFSKKNVIDNRDLVIMLLDTGARLNEINHLKWKHIFLSEGYISLYRPKVGNQSLIYLTDRAITLLKNRSSHSTDKDAFVFQNSTTGPKRTMKGIRNAIKRAGLDDVTIHTFRHTAASRLAQAGMPLNEIQVILGHTTMQTTLRYAHLNQQVVTKKACEILNANHIQKTSYSLNNELPNEANDAHHYGTSYNVGASNPVSKSYTISSLKTMQNASILSGINTQKPTSLSFTTEKSI